MPKTTSSSATSVVAGFSTVAAARAAIRRLQQAGLPHDDIELLGADPPAKVAQRGGRDAPVLRSVFWQIALWGIVGGVVGAGAGYGFTLTGIGPGGATGAVLQIAGWAMFGHIIASLWAGYAVLGTRSTRDLTWRRQRDGQILVRVRCATAAVAATAEEELCAAGASGTSRYAP